MGRSCAGEGMVQGASGPAYTFQKFLWMLRGEEAAGGRQEGIHCSEAVAEPRGDKTRLQEDSGSGVESGRIKSSTVSSHAPFTVWLRA